ncbi:hypothetical protein BOTBODRAFT_493501 [Botryobasidium botryosum FD-172 SS1]|uniref:F-box domain-containing protein n=1 Tax=Botryobasidium botryosum (strain FD-172 SS1) TaxID=930990 RepID=A0A067MG20_BOTB1|nr:hypothetical protein BOTBODRAFT_493501 [Botryobasidium botryosum FD-172 SS1]
MSTLDLICIPKATKPLAASACPAERSASATAPPFLMSGVALPDEIFDYIFQLGASRGRDLRTAMALSQVCRHWRALALANSRLWSHFHFEPYKLLQPDPDEPPVRPPIVFVDRLRGSPPTASLFISEADLPNSWDQSGPGSESRAAVLRLTYCSGFISALRPVLGALEVKGACFWQGVHVIYGEVFTREAVARLELGQPFPSLEVLKIHLPRLPIIPSSQHVLWQEMKFRLGEAPRLRSLSLLGAALDLSGQDIREQLRYLQFSPSVRLCSGALLKTIQIFPHLTTLSISVTQFSTTDMEASTVPLDHLEVLCVCFVDALSPVRFGRLWEKLSLPRLRSLAFDAPTLCRVKEPKSFLGLLFRHTPQLRIESFSMSRIILDHFPGLLCMMPNLRFLRLYPDVPITDALVINQLATPAGLDGKTLHCPNLEEIVIGSEQVGCESLRTLLEVRASKGNKPLRQLSTPRWEELLSTEEGDKIGETTITSCKAEGHWDDMEDCEEMRQHHISIATAVRRHCESLGITAQIDDDEVDNVNAGAELASNSTTPWPWSFCKSCAFA